jgi:hypothetical protein
VPSPVELRQIGYQAGADFLEGVESNVIERQMLARAIEHVVEALIPYLCTEPVAPTAPQGGGWMPRWKRK